MQTQCFADFIGDFVQAVSYGIEPNLTSLLLGNRRDVDFMFSKTSLGKFCRQ